LQDQIATSIFMGNVQDKGLVDAVSIWQSGVPLSQAMAEGRADVNMSTADYTKKFLTAFGVNQQRQAQGSDPIYRDAARFGSNWPKLPPEQRQSIVMAEDAINVMKSSVDFVKSTDGKYRAANPSETAYMQTQWQATVLPYLQQRFQAGAMQEGELELFNELAGRGFDLTRFTDKEVAKMEAIMTMAERDLVGKKRSLGLSPDMTDPFNDYTQYTPPGSN